MTSSIHCALPANSDSITMTVNPRPYLNFDPDTVYIKPMDTVALDPLTSGSVASWGWSPTQWLEDPAALNPVSAPGLSINYTLTLTGTDGCVVSATKSIIVFVPLLMPNAFTPNSDGRNDLFRIPPRTPEQLISFTVYNRWGERVFYTREPSAGWDGRFNNSPQPAGAYVWVIRYLDPFRHEILTSSGTVMLIR
jgi:gliding motility-associated-like protein